MDFFNSKKRAITAYDLKFCGKTKIKTLIGVVTVAILTIIWSYGNYKRMQFNQQEESSVLLTRETSKSKKIFWMNVPITSNRTYGMTEVLTVLERLGYEKGTSNSDWDLFWAQDPYSIEFYEQTKKLKPYQKVSRFPGNWVLGVKVILATSGLEYIPPAFRLPEDKDRLLEFSKRQPEATFVIKANSHGSIQLAKINEIDFDNESNKFVQQFIDKPLLLNGYKFDIGIYTFITSIDPLRIYVYNGDILIRLCSQPYYPFDPETVKNYAWMSKYLEDGLVPGMDYYLNTLGFSKKDALNAYLQNYNIDTDSIWRQAEDAIAKYVLAKEPYIVEVLQEYPSKRNFFELYRFDFVIDENIKVYILECNRGPNLDGSYLLYNRLLYHQVLYNFFGLIGVGDRLNRTSLAPRSKSEEEMLVAEKNILTFPNICNNDLCKSSCDSLQCQLCTPCLTEESKEFLKEAAREHYDRGDCKRIYPPLMIQDQALKGTDLSNLSLNDQLQYRWFEGKCLMDKTWCLTL